MAPLAGIVVAAHALTGAMFLGALIGRWIVLGLAARADTLASMQTLSRAARPFERMVIWSSVLVLALGILAAIARGRPFLGPVQGAPVDWLFVSLLLFLSVLPLVRLVFLPRGRVFDAAMGDAVSRGEVTGELAQAWRDPVVRAAHIYELGAVTVVFLLMIAKPF
jgi:Predicted integral membrane protein (DUF2269)